MIKLKRVLSGTIFFVVLTNQVFAQTKYNSILSLPMALPDEKTINISDLPKISKWYQSCKRSEDIKNKSDWGFCNAYLYAVMQHHYDTSLKKCPNISVQEVLNAVDKEALEYKEMHSKPAKGRDGKLIEGARTYQPNTIYEWNRPAFSVLSSVLEKECIL